MVWPISPTHLINNIDAHLVTKSDLLKFSIDGLDDLANRIDDLKQLIAETGRGRARTVSTHADTGHAKTSVWTVWGTREENMRALEDFCKCVTAKDLEHLVIVAYLNTAAWVPDLIAAARNYCNSLKTICRYQHHSDRIGYSGHAVVTCLRGFDASTPSHLIDAIAALQHLRFIHGHEKVAWAAVPTSLTILVDPAVSHASIGASYAGLRFGCNAIEIKPSVPGTLYPVALSVIIGQALEVVDPRNGPGSLNYLTFTNFEDTDGDVIEAAIRAEYLMIYLQEHVRLGNIALNFVFTTQRAVGFDVGREIASVIARPYCEAFRPILQDAPPARFG